MEGELNAQLLCPDQEGRNSTLEIAQAVTWLLHFQTCIPILTREEKRTACVPSRQTPRKPRAGFGCKHCFRAGFGCWEACTAYFGRSCRSHCLFWSVDGAAPAPAPASNAPPSRCDQLSRWPHQHRRPRLRGGFTSLGPHSKRHFNSLEAAVTRGEELGRIGARLPRPVRPRHDTAWSRSRRTRCPRLLDGQRQWNWRLWAGSGALPQLLVGIRAARGLSPWAQRAAPG